MSDNNKYADVRFNFKEDEDGFLSLESLNLGDTNVSIDQLDSVAEGWAQSDMFWVGVTNALVCAITSKVPLSPEDFY